MIPLCAEMDAQRGPAGALAGFNVMESAYFHLGTTIKRNLPLRRTPATVSPRAA